MAGKPGRSGQKAEKPWHDVLKLVVNQRDAAGVKLLRRIAEKTVQMALDGDLDAIKEVGNRLEGRPAQEVRLADADGDAFGVGLLASFEAAAIRAREAQARLVGYESAPTLPPVVTHAPLPVLCQPHAAQGRPAPTPAPVPAPQPAPFPQVTSPQVWDLKSLRLPPRS